jgi:hypothetical protein
MRAAHEAALAKQVNFALAPLTVPVGTKVLLTDYWRKSEVVQDTGIEFTGYHQITGACVGASAGNAVNTLNMVQRMIADNPTKAFIAWWPYAYGRSRLFSGMPDPGEGSFDSVMGKVLRDEGVFSIEEEGQLPEFSTTDGFMLTQSIELAWSDGDSHLVESCKPTACRHPVGGVASLYSAEDVKNAILNGYPVLEGCRKYVSTASIRQAGSDSYVRGTWDGNGGHSTCILGFWSHPRDGPLYLYSNQWPASTYPEDPAGGGRCCCWINERDMESLFQLGGGNGETMALSHLSYFPAQADKILSWYI